MRTFRNCENCGKPAKGAHRLWCGKDPAPRFWAKVDRRGPDECWPWSGSRKPRGYGHFIIGRRDHNAHRLAYELANGPITDGMHVLHSCDNPPCCNPAHLFLGTHTDNMHDMRLKSRDPRVTLTLDKVRQIRSELASNDDRGIQVRLAAKYQVKPGVISAIAVGKTFRYVK